MNAPRELATLLLAFGRAGIELANVTYFALTAFGLASMMAASVWTFEILKWAGAAYLAGLKIGFYPEPADFAKRWSLDRRFLPAMREDERARKYAGWQNAVRRTLTNPIH